MLVFTLICLCSIGILVLWTDSQKRELKEDLVELSNIKYGLFNVDEWKIILSDLLTKKIEEFEIDQENRVQMKEKISNFLHKVIDDLENRFHEENSSSITGFFKNTIASLTGTFNKIKKDIPIFTEDIINFLDDPENKKDLRNFLIVKLNEYADNTFAKLDYTVHDAILLKYKLHDRSSTIESIGVNQARLQTRTEIYKFLLLVIAIVTAAIVLFSSELVRADFTLLTIICFLFLILGLLLPMIEIDARIAELNLSLLGEQIKFQDQVLFYKSKSILEVIRLMFVQNTLDLLLVGFLVFSFSVLFPLSKLIALLYLSSTPQLNPSKFVRFLVHKTGKWSMADVMVVAIFMAYIGFSGILSEQLNQLQSLSSTIEVLTTNKSSLQIGFFTFTSFALLSLMTTNKLKNNLPDEKVVETV